MDRSIEREIKRRYELDSAWRSPKGIKNLWLLHEKRKIIEMLPGSVSRSLDLGAGRGRFLKELAEVSNEVIAYDISMNMLKSAKKVAIRESLNAFLLQGSCHSLPFPAKVFDLILAIQIIASSTDVIIFLTEISRILKPDGILILSTGNSFSFDFNLITDKLISVYKHMKDRGIRSTLKKILKIFSRDRTFWLLEQGYCRDSYFFLKNALRSTGFCVRKVCGVGVLRRPFLGQIENLSSKSPFKYFSFLTIFYCKKL